MKPSVIKIGGALVAEPGALGAFWEAISTLRKTSPVLIVHGGGPQATTLARRLGHEPRVVQGRRVTGDLDLDVMLWAVRGGINARFVAAAQRSGILAAGLSGADGGLIRVSKRPPWRIEHDTVDFGWVGDVEKVQADVVEALLSAGFLPVIAPLGIDEEGQLFNVNADTVASAIAGAIDAEQLLLVTESGGVQDAGGALLRRCDAATYKAGTEAGWIAGGMRVKLHVAFEALRAGVNDVAILSPDDLLTRAGATQVVEDISKPIAGP